MGLASARWGSTVLASHTGRLRARCPRCSSTVLPMHAQPHTFSAAAPTTLDPEAQLSTESWKDPHEVCNLWSLYLQGTSKAESLWTESCSRHVVMFFSLLCLE